MNLVGAQWLPRWYAAISLTIKLKTSIQETLYWRFHLQPLWTDRVMAISPNPGWGKLWSFISNYFRRDAFDLKFLLNFEAPLALCQTLVWPWEKHPPNHALTFTTFRQWFSWYRYWLAMEFSLHRRFLSYHLVEHKISVTKRHLQTPLRCGFGKAKTFGLLV